MKFEQPPAFDFEQVTKKIEENLEYAKQHALSRKEIDRLMAERRALTTVPKEQRDYEKIQEVSAKIEKTMVFVKTLPEFRTLLEMISSDEKAIQDALSHENAHGNMADLVGGSHDAYMLVVSKNNGEYSYLPVAHTLPPQDVTERERLEAQIKIAHAPDVYGNVMSEGDKDHAEKFNQRLRELEDEE